MEHIEMGEKMNSKDIFNFIVEEFKTKNVNYVILHSYQKLPYEFDSDIDIAIDIDKIENAIQLLDKTLIGTGWKVIQYWRHEYYAVDCVISNDVEFLQVDFCIHYERNGRIVMPIEELVRDKQEFSNFYIPSIKVEFTYIILKKILKKNFSERSKDQLSLLWKKMSYEERDIIIVSLNRFLDNKTITNILDCVQIGNYNNINMHELHQELLRKTSDISSNLHYIMFDIKRKIERIIHPTGLFIVLLGVDGAGKTTIATQLINSYTTAFRKINHYHSRVRILKDISQIGSKEEQIDASDPHGKKYKAGVLVSVIKFMYYFMDYVAGNFIISTAKIRSSLVLIERYYYDYAIDKKRYNLKLSDNFIGFFGHFVKKPDVIFILTGDSKILLERKHEITIDQIEEQKNKLEVVFKNNPKSVFIDTTTTTVEECVSKMLQKCNSVMRGRRKWN